MAVKIHLLFHGKTKEAWLQEALDIYTKRLTPYALLTFLPVKCEEALYEKAKSYKAPLFLDPAGEERDSLSFHRMLQNKLEKEGSPLAFVIGGPSGHPEKIREQEALLSLSKLTLTHQMTRLLLIEQIYRSFMISKGTPYHK